VEPSLAGTTTGANALSVVARFPTAERWRENVGTKEETTEIGLPCNAEGTRDGEDPGKPTPNTRKADVRAPRSGDWAATPSALEDNGRLFVGRLGSASAGEETAIQSFTKADFTALIIAAKKTGSGMLGARVDEAGLEPDGTTRLSVKLASEGRGMLIAEHGSKGSLIYPTEVDEDCCSFDELNSSQKLIMKKHSWQVKAKQIAELQWRTASKQLAL